MSSSLRLVALNVSLAVAYFAAAKLSLTLAIPPGYATAVWPPSGLALAALVLGGPALWPAVWLGATAVNFTIQFSLPAALAIGAGNTLEALAAWWLVQRRAVGPEWPFAQPRQGFVLAAAALVSSAIAASVASAVLVGSGALGGDWGSTWITWWLGDAAGMIILAPLVLAWARPAQRPAVLELVLLGLTLVAVCSVVFFGWIFGSRTLPLAFLVLPLIIWAGLRFTAREVATACAITAGFAIASTLAGNGPFQSDDRNLTLLQTQIFLSTLVVTGLALAAAVRELRRAREEVEQFVYTAAHDLQEPLRNILNFSDLLTLKYRERLDAEARELLGFVAGGAERMRRLIEDLLAVARASRAVVSVEWTDSGRALAAALEALKARSDETGAQITHDRLPHLLADPRLLESVFENLVGNALKYRGAEPPRLHVGAARQGAEWVFSVRDNGIGIAPRYHGVIFEMFQRLERKPGERSTGVGLAICRRIVERHGGRIWVQSAPQRGATFFFSLPAGGGRADG